MISMTGQGAKNTTPSTARSPKNSTSTSACHSENPNMICATRTITAMRQVATNASIHRLASAAASSGSMRSKGMP
ncbi:MAG: hypothetical protein KBG84_09730 [Planctomycetes bacterium]|nr:hypothetical protein [Planctomycetota bacterium]